MQIAEIVVTPTTVNTPLGELDRARTHWTLGAAVPISTSTPMWAIICAVVLIPCTVGLSLLFLLAKEPSSWGSQLTVTDGRLTFTTTVYSRSRREWIGIRDAVALAQRPSQPPAGSTGQFALPSGS